MGPLRELARAHTEEAVQTLVSVMRSAKSPPAARIRAAELLLDRGWGKAETKTGIGSDNPFSQVSDAELDGRIVQTLVDGGIPLEMAEKFIAPRQQRRMTYQPSES
jgi:hypothetical protein